MATTRTETAARKKSAVAAARARKTSAAQSPDTRAPDTRSPHAKRSDGPLTAGTIIAERYRDTAYEGLVGKQGENVTAVMSAGEAMFSGLAEVSQEVMSFANERLRADMECAEDFAKATSPQDLFDRQCSFARRAAEQYAQQTSKLIGMMARIQQNCWAPMEACTKAALQGLDGGADGEAKK